MRDSAYIVVEYITYEGTLLPIMVIIIIVGSKVIIDLSVKYASRVVINGGTVAVGAVALGVQTYQGAHRRVGELLQVPPAHVS